MNIVQGYRLPTNYKSIHFVCVCVGGGGVFVSESVCPCVCVWACINQLCDLLFLSFFLLVFFCLF